MQLLLQIPWAVASIREKSLSRGCLPAGVCPARTLVQAAVRTCRHPAGIMTCPPAKQQLLGKIWFLVTHLSLWQGKPGVKLDGWSICKVRNTGVRIQKGCVLPKFRQSLMPRETTEGDFWFHRVGGVPRSRNEAEILCQYAGEGWSCSWVTGSTPHAFTFRKSAPYCPLPPACTSSLLPA